VVFFLAVAATLIYFGVAFKNATVSLTHCGAAAALVGCLIFNHADHLPLRHCSALNRSRCGV
jgi:hypothetical protein